MKTTDYTEFLKMNPEELRRLQKTKGKVLSFVGNIVYKTLILLGFTPKDYYGICPYFEIGKGGWGLELGWFFICSKGAKESLKNHEVGHNIQNAAVGGWKMVFYCVGSVFRFWYRRIFGIIRPRYDDWWFEGQATEIGNKYVDYIKKGEKNND